MLFGTRAYLQSPVTFDRQSVREILRSMDAGMAGNSTSIGDALGLALKSIRESGGSEERIIILLTDGENNDGSLSMAQAINLARNEKVKVYTIGVGAENAFVRSLFGMRIAMPGGIDEEGLKPAGGRNQRQLFPRRRYRGTAENICRNRPSGTERKRRPVRARGERPVLLAAVGGAAAVVFDRVFEKKGNLDGRVLKRFSFPSPVVAVGGGGAAGRLFPLFCRDEERLCLGKRL